MYKYLIFFLFFNFSLKAGSITNVFKELKNIPVEEREQIHHFFHEIIQHYGFGYTLFGNMPISTECWLTVPDYTRKNPYFSVSEEFVASYDVWKKHLHRFPSKKFIFSERYLSIGTTEYTDLILVNKIAFDEKVRLHPTYFQNGYNVNTFIENEKIEKYDLKNPENIVEGYHMRMGILLGYGKENALEFTRRIKESAKDKNPSEWILFKDIIKTERKKNEPFPSVFFVIPNTCETQALLREFTQTQKKLCEILNDENFLQIVLEEYSSS